MQIVKIREKVRKDGQLKINIPNLESGDKEIIVIIEDSNVDRYDFTRLSGRLQWQGDAVKEQRKLRNEW